MKRPPTPLFQELAFVFLRVIGQAAERGDLDLLRQLRIDSGKANQIRNMPLSQLEHLARLGDAYLEFRVDGHALALMIERSRELQRESDLQEQLILARAPWPLLKELFGTPELEFCRLRKFHGLGRNGGRPSIPNEQQEAQFWTVWMDSEGGNMAERLLEIHARTEIPLNSAWTLLKDDPEQLKGDD